MRKYQLKTKIVFTEENGEQVSEQRASDIEQLIACFQYHRPLGENSPISPKAALNMASVALAFFDARVETEDSSESDSIMDCDCVHNHRELRVRKTWYTEGGEIR